VGFCSFFLSGFLKTGLHGTELILDCTHWDRDRIGRVQVVYCAQGDSGYRIDQVQGSGSGTAHTGQDSLGDGHGDGHCYRGSGVLGLTLRESIGSREP